MLDKMRLLTPGPTPLPERVRLNLALDMIHHRKSEFKGIMADVQGKLRLLFGTSQDVLTLTASGTGAMVAAVTGLFAPGEKILVIDGGKFAQRWSEIATSHGIIPITLKIEPGHSVQPALLEKALQENPEVKGVCVQLCETSTGVQHPIRELAAITSKTEKLLVVDGISGIGISPCPMDAWGIDCMLTGSQKGLMLPPGISILALSARAWKKAESITTYNFYFNILAERNNIGKNQTNFTPAIGILRALNESLDIFMEAGLGNIYRKQWALSAMARTGILAMGLELFAADSPAWGVTSVKLPAGVNSGPILSRAAYKYNVVMAAGQDELKNQIIRIGHMGWVDWSDLAAGLHALAESFKHCGGHIGARNYLEEALRVYWKELKNFKL